MIVGGMVLKEVIYQNPFNKQKFVHLNKIITFIKGYREGCFRWNGNIPSTRFPDTLEYVWNKTGLPITAHNKFWDISVEYAIDNGGSYAFIIDEFGSKSLPIDQQFWMDLFANASRWGLKTYEQVDFFVDL